MCFCRVFALAFRSSSFVILYKRPKVAAMEDDSQLLDLTQWDYNDLDFRTPQLSGINSRGASFVASPSPSPSGQRPRLPLLFYS
jgi:hypothetical protein